MRIIICFGSRIQSCVYSGLRFCSGQDLWVQLCVEAAWCAAAGVAFIRSFCRSRRQSCIPKWLPMTAKMVVSESCQKSHNRSVCEVRATLSELMPPAEAKALKAPQLPSYSASEDGDKSSALFGRACSFPEGSRCWPQNAALVWLLAREGRRSALASMPTP